MNEHETFVALREICDGTVRYKMRQRDEMTVRDAYTPSPQLIELQGWLSARCFEGVPMPRSALAAHFFEGGFEAIDKLLRKTFAQPALADMLELVQVDIKLGDRGEPTTGTKTGRFSSAAPNMSNVPRRDR